MKQILTEAVESKEEKVHSLAKQTAGIILYSVPHKGSDVASKINSASQILLPSSDISQLKTGKISLYFLCVNIIFLFPYNGIYMALTYN